MLKDDLKVLLASEFSFYLKAANFHWNVEGTNFPQYHEFLGNLYAEIYGSIDKIAEYIRTLDSYAPGSLTRFTELSIISDQLKIPRAELMFAELEADNIKLIEYLNHCFGSAEMENQQGIANFIAERLDAHNKHSWMIRSILKTSRMQ
jgi:starvation-inducible DNA-binding protein